MVADMSGSIKTFKTQPLDGKVTTRGNEPLATVPDALKNILKQRLAEGGQAKAKSIPVELFEAKNFDKIPKVGMQPNEKPTFPEDLFRNAITRSLTGNGRQLNGDASKMSPHDIAAHYSSTIESVLTAIAPQQRIEVASRLEKAIGEIVAELRIV
uniref:Uncharacterized protein n=1 Tax=Acrobeloides nanus TaxID=290746 RepID=A0A914CXC7_9BILA